MVTRALRAVCMTTWPICTSRPRMGTSTTFRACGFAAAIASSSMTTELVTGMSLEEAEGHDEEMVVATLGGFPEDKIKCSALVPEALRQALADYHRKLLMISSVEVNG